VGFRDDIRKLCFELRAIPGRDFEIRPYTVKVVLRQWSGDEPGQGVETVTSIDITESDGQPPKVRWLTDEEIAVGGYDQSTVEVGPITPSFPGGGTLITTLGQDPPPNTLFDFVLTGPQYPDGAIYRLKALHSDKTFQYRAVLERAR
tara:strand:- start:4695 stop:5135 length:441 start_codon:yes stop_codon:yes gene_type:complete